MRQIKKIVLEEKKDLFWKSSSISDMFKSVIKISKATGVLPGQAMNSIFDAVYFIDLKQKARIFHVKDYIQGFQATLLFTCKFFIRQLY